MQLTENEIRDWMENEVTKEFFSRLRQFQEELVYKVSRGKCLSKHLPTETVYARETGKIDLLDSLLTKDSVWSESNEEVSTVLHESYS